MSVFGNLEEMFLLSQGSRKLFLTCQFCQQSVFPACCCIISCSEFHSDTRGVDVTTLRGGHGQASRNTSGTVQQWRYMSHELNCSRQPITDINPYRSGISIRFKVLVHPKRKIQSSSYTLPHAHV